MACFVTALGLFHETENRERERELANLQCFRTGNNERKVNMITKRTGCSTVYLWRY